MEVRKCPKCGAENKAANVTCSTCYASMEGGSLAESQINDEPIAAPQQSTPGVERFTPIFNDAPSPAPKKSAPIGTIVAIVVVLGAAFAGWWLFMRPKGPEQVVLGFVEATNLGDYEKIKPFLSEGTINMIEGMPGAKEGLARGLRMNHSMKGENAKSAVKIIKTTYEGDDNNKAIVEAESLDKADQTSGMDPKQEIVLVREDKEWKIDLMGTMQRMMQKMFKGGPPRSFSRPSGPPMGGPMRPGMPR